ncbi:MAG: hypothetical protein Q8O93_04675 [bacterium]|nr:hypothetical protein [bacterium]
MPFFLLAWFFVFGQAVKAAAADYILSGGPNPEDNFCVDDDIYVYLNDELIYADIDPRWAGCNNRPINFQAAPAAELRVAAIDSAGICRSLGPLWLHYGDQSLELFSGRDDGCLWWPAGVTFYDQTFTLPGQAEPEPLIIVPGILGSWNVSGRWQIDPIFHTYDNLMEALIAAGYRENSLGEEEPNLFTFPYDWRADNNITAGLLKEKIRQVKEITGAAKVDLVAHSMGGLVARSYIQGDGYLNDVDQVIFLGTPHLGAPESYLRYEGAIFTGTLSWLQKYYFQAEAAINGYFDLVDYIKARVPTAEQLLPIYDYLRDKQSDNTWQLRPYPLNYPQNNYLESLNNVEAINLLKQRVNITNIIGDLEVSSTINNLRVVPDPNSYDNYWQNGYPENLETNHNSLEMGRGDTTVPLNSADGLEGVEAIKTNIADHINLPTVMQKEIINALTGTTPESYYSGKITSSIKKWLFFRVYSPVDFAIVAPDGSRVGKDFLNNSEINQIPDAFYSGFNSGAEFVLIPNPDDGEYKIEVQGVDNGGEYTVAGSLINDNEEIGAQFTGTIAPNAQREFTLDYSAQAENPLSELAPMDDAPPLIIINEPTADKQYAHSDKITIDYSVSDDFSGVATTTIMIDGQAAATTTLDLFDYPLGTHTLAITALDYAGNQAREEVDFAIIATIDSAIADLERIYDLGWFDSGPSKAALVQALKLTDPPNKPYDKLMERLKQLIKQAEGNNKLNDKIKRKMIEQYNRKIDSLTTDWHKTVINRLNIIARLLNNAKKQKVINQQGYDIMINNINYLKNNL